uniref:Uncharacterized protein n=1 Tax=Knipowitschia caucasica TaxID=637954 RepID=A0AAV2MCV9_KNICA
MSSTCMFQKAARAVRSPVLCFPSPPPPPPPPPAETRSFRSINSVSRSRLLSPSMLQSLASSSGFFLSRWWNGKAPKADNGTPSLCSS